MGAPSHAAGNDRPQAVSTNGESSPDGVSPAVPVSNDSACDGALVIKQLLQRGSFEHKRTGAAGGANQLVIQDSARHRKPSRTKGPR